MLFSREKKTLLQDGTLQDKQTKALSFAVAQVQIGRRGGNTETMLSSVPLSPLERGCREETPVPAENRDKTVFAGQRLLLPLSWKNYITADIVSFLSQSKCLHGCCSL